MPFDGKQELYLHAIIVYIAGMKAIQYTIRRVPEQIDRLVRQEAKKTNKSLNAVLSESLKCGIGGVDKPVEYHDLDGLAGTWVDDPDFDAAMEAFET